MECELLLSRRPNEGMRSSAAAAVPGKCGGSGSPEPPGLGRAEELGEDGTSGTCDLWGSGGAPEAETPRLGDPMGVSAPPFRDCVRGHSAAGASAWVDEVS